MQLGNPLVKKKCQSANIVQPGPPPGGGGPGGPLCYITIVRGDPEGVGPAGPWSLPPGRPHLSGIPCVSDPTASGPKAFEGERPVTLKGVPLRANAIGRLLGRLSCFDGRLDPPTAPPQCSADGRPWSV